MTPNDQPDSMSKDEGLLPCPFCGREAEPEHLEGGAWSIGCPDDDCIGFMSVATFARKAEAITAWNRRPTPSSADNALREALAEHYPTGPWKQPQGYYALPCSCGEMICGSNSEDAKAKWASHCVAALSPSSGEPASVAGEELPYSSDDWKLKGYPSAAAEIEDMANVGRSLMQAIEKDYADHPFMKGWRPADCPTEIVGDLLNALDEAKPTPVEAGALPLEEAIRCVIWEAWRLLDETANDNPPEVPQDAWDRLDHAMDQLEALIPESEEPCYPSVAARVFREKLAALSQPGSSESGGWSPIETAPKDGTWFLGYWPVHTREERVCATSWSDDAIDGYMGRFVDIADHIDWTQPTHWTPLPSTPSSKERQP